MNYDMTANCEYFVTHVLSYLNLSKIVVAKPSILIGAESFWFLVLVFGGVQWLCLVVSGGGVWWCPVVVFGGFPRDSRPSVCERLCCEKVSKPWVGSLDEQLN